MGARIIEKQGTEPGLTFEADPLTSPDHLHPPTGQICRQTQYRSFACFSCAMLMLHGRLQACRTLIVRSAKLD
jgi:hypothetical protein